MLMKTVEILFLGMIVTVYAVPAMPDVHACTPVRVIHCNIITKFYLFFVGKSI